MAVFTRLFFDMPDLGRVNAKSGGSIKLPGMKRTMVMADTGAVGPSEAPIHGELKFSLMNQAGLSLKALSDITNQQITVQDDSGKTWTCSGAFVTEPPTLTNGEIALSMQFASAEEVK